MTVLLKRIPSARRIFSYIQTPIFPGPLSSRDGRPLCSFNLCRGRFIATSGWSLLGYLYGRYLGVSRCARSCHTSLLDDTFKHTVIHRAPFHSRSISYPYETPRNSRNHCKLENEKFIIPFFLFIFTKRRIVSPSNVGFLLHG